MLRCQRRAHCLSQAGRSHRDRFVLEVTGDGVMRVSAFGRHLRIGSGGGAVICQCRAEHFEFRRRWRVFRPVEPIKPIPQRLAYAPASLCWRARARSTGWSMRRRGQTVTTASANPAVIEALFVCSSTPSPTRTASVSLCATGLRIMTKRWQPRVRCVRNGACLGPSLKNS